MPDTIRYWRALDERQADPEPLLESAERHAFAAEFQAGLHSRRGFLKAAGFGVAGAVAASCSRAPVEKAIPFLVKPEEITPGTALYYTSTCHGCSAGCGLVVKNRDGRPIKLEGNPDHPLSRGSTCAVGQASILGLYDQMRLSKPLWRGQPASWAQVDDEIRGRLAGSGGRPGRVRVLTGTCNSPTLQHAIDAFLARIPDARHVAYDPLSCSAMLDAHQRTHGARVLPRVRLGAAQVIVSLDADFLGTWVSPVEFTNAYRDGRGITEGTRSRSLHVHIEPRLSLTGSKADRRFVVLPGHTGVLATHLAGRLAKLAGVAFDTPGLEAAPMAERDLTFIVSRLWEHRGRSVVLSGSQRVAEQVVVNFINHLLGNYGTVLNLDEPSYQRMGDDRALGVLVDECRSGNVDVLIVAGVNPACELPAEAGFREAMARVALTVHVGQQLDETATLAQIVCPESHFLEAWADTEAVAGVVSLTQPVIEPFGDTRTLVELLAAWSGAPAAALDIYRESWRTVVHPRSKTGESFDSFWDGALQAGVAKVDPIRPDWRPFDAAVVQPVSHSVPLPPGELALVLYPKTGMLDGRHAHNAWLHELPDPISKVTWDNYACLAPAAAARAGVATGDMVRIEPGASATDRSSGSAAIDLPVLVQPGQHPDVVAIALGYGRAGTERFARIGPQWIDARPAVGSSALVGVNAAPLLGYDGGLVVPSGRGVRLRKLGGRRPLACVQSHHSLSVPSQLAFGAAGARSIVQDIALSEVAADRIERAATGNAHVAGTPADLWPSDHRMQGHHWGLMIDLDACTGCGACTLACQVENNIPVVGRDEVLRSREMHWMRIDRYYADRADGGVEVVHQPMLCQHCERAPCETVCPVLATVHSDDGLNQQVYNRCVGTRYCANNCPYKVRRFNWFNYPHADERQNLVLNPDVTVRSRGVMEKCSLCVQRIQESRLEARRQKRPLADGDITTACEQVCPARAITFGDLNDPRSRASRLAAGRRHYTVLEELNLKPSIGYLKIIRQES